MSYEDDDEKMRRRFHLAWALKGSISKEVYDQVSEYIQKLLKERELLKPTQRILVEIYIYDLGQVVPMEINSESGPDILKRIVLEMPKILRGRLDSMLWCRKIDSADILFKMQVEVLFRARSEHYKVGHFKTLKALGVVLNRLGYKDTPLACSIKKYLTARKKGYRY